jgi:serine/threonine protein phosphatase PrpC
MTKNASSGIPVLQELLAELLARPVGARRIQMVPGLALATTKGPVRPENQDRVLALYVRRENAHPSEFFLGVVADGLGGMADGGGAAELAISVFAAAVVAGFDGGATSMSDAANAANREVFRRYKGKGGATLTALAVPKEGVPSAVHAGDSRLYEYVEGTGLSLITRDDTMAGVLAGADRESAPDNRLLQFAGVGHDFSPHSSMLNRIQDVVWAITSDGAHNVGKSIVSEVFAASTGASDVARRLWTIAEATGAKDNATILTFSPGEFDPPRTLSGGSAVMAYTPGEKVELWFPSSPVEAGRQRPERRSTPEKWDPRAKPDRRRGSRQAKLTGEASATEPVSLGDSDKDKVSDQPSEKPQLSIVFAVDPEPR